MVSAAYEVRLTRRAEKDVKKLTPQLRRKLYEILTEVIAQDPFQGKKWVGDLAGSYSCRLTYRDRIVYSINAKERVVYIERAATHDGE